MCNANNHPPNCPCGWGEGINFSFSSKFHSQYSQFKTDYFEKVMDAFPPPKFSLTIPNAICPNPKCVAKVYFYQNHYGSRVYFDSLGTPWPKHPCTDTTGYSTKDKKEFDFSDKEFYTIPEQNLTDNTLSENYCLKNIVYSI